MTSKSSQPLLRQLWIQWKTLKLPWRRQWLCGQDLAGNTFWEFHNPLPPFRPRRIVKYPRGTHHGDVALPPAWLQWLRHTRPSAPSIEEQQFEVQRQASVRMLAQQADARWKEKESWLDRPQDTGQELPLPTKPLDKAGYGGPKGAYFVPEGVRSVAATQEEVTEKTSRVRDQGKGKGDEEEKVRGKSPWDVQHGATSEGWQPQSWSPGKVNR